MADTTGMDWQRQNFAKGGKAEAAPSQMNPKTWGGPATSMNSKIAKPTHPCGGMVKGGMANGGMVRGYADGGEVTEASDKAAGLKASAGESVGFFKRLSMGNIDQEGSEAYNKFGAGRGAAERIKALPDDGSNDMAESKRLGASKPVEPVKAPEPVKAEEPEEKYGRDSVREVTPAKVEAPAPAPVKTAARVIKPAPKAEAPKQSLAQSKGAEFATFEKIARDAEENPGVSMAARQAARANANRARKVYEDAADAEATGRSVVFKR